MDVKKIGVFLAELRKDRNLTQAELGEKIGVTNKTVRIALGKRQLFAAC